MYTEKVEGRSSNLEEKFYGLSDKLAVTQGQVNTLFAVLEDLKKSMESIASDIKAIRNDLHGLSITRLQINTAETNIKELQTVTTDLNLWKQYITGAVGVSYILIPFIVEMILRFHGQD